MNIDGLGISTAQATWLGRPATVAMEHEARAAGLVLGESNDEVTLTAGCVATADALKRFVAQSDGVAGDVLGRLVAPYDRWSDQRAFGPPARLIRLRGGGEISPSRLAAARPIEVGAKGQAFDVPLMDRVGGRVETFEASLAVVMNRSRWPGVVWANLLGLGPALLSALPGPAALAPARVALAALRAGSVDPGAMGLRLVRKGKAVVVHPSAVVEGSWLLDGARIDAGAIVRHSIIGPGAIVEPQALCVGSVLGPGALLQRRGFSTFGSLERNSVCGGTLQLGYVGHQAQLKVGAILLDQALGGPVRALVDGELRRVPFDLLGAALGARAVVGAGVHVAAGRLVPVDTEVVGGPDQVLVRPNPSGPGRYRVVQGGLEPC